MPRLHSLIFAFLQWFLGLWARIVGERADARDETRRHLDADVEACMSTGRQDWGSSMLRAEVPEVKSPDVQPSKSAIGVHASRCSTRPPRCTTVQLTVTPTTPPLIADSPALTATNTPLFTPRTSPSVPTPTHEKSHPLEEDIADSSRTCGPGFSPPLSRLYPCTASSGSTSTSTSARKDLLTPALNLKAEPTLDISACARDPHARDGQSYFPDDSAEVAKVLRVVNPDLYDSSFYQSQERRKRESGPGMSRQAKQDITDASVVCDVVLPLTPVLESKTRRLNAQAEDTKPGAGASDISTPTPAKDCAGGMIDLVHAKDAILHTLSTGSPPTTPIVPFGLAIAALPSSYTLEAIDASASSLSMPPPSCSSFPAPPSFIPVASPVAPASPPPSFQHPSFASWVAELSRAGSPAPETRRRKLVDLLARSAPRIPASSSTASQIASAGAEGTSAVTREETRRQEGEPMREENGELFYADAIRQVWHISPSIEDILSLLEGSFESGTTDGIFGSYDEEPGWDDEGQGKPEGTEEGDYLSEEIRGC